MMNLIFTTILSLFFSIVYASDKLSQIDQKLTQFLQKSVSDGLVNYQAIQSNQDDLISLIYSYSLVSKDDFDSWAETKGLSYLINYYNLATIDLIVQNYPVKSIKDIGGWFTSPWSIEFVMLFGKKVSLDYIEHTLIRKNFKEPRVHMALVCASIGCPILRNEAYTAENLNQQLDEQTKLYLESKNGLQIDEKKKKVSISSIFKWYKEDFSSVRDFIQIHSDKDLQNYTIDFIDYNWNLNDLKTKNKKYESVTN